MLLKNATYLNDSFQVVKGNLLIEDGKVSVLTSPCHHNEVVDCSDYVIIPGLYNAHFHGYSLLAKGIARDMKIEDWCNDTAQGKAQTKFFENIDKLSKEDYQFVLMKAYIEMVKQGIVFASESEPSNWPESAAEALNNVGLKGFVDCYGDIESYYDRKIGRISFGTHLLEEEDITDETLKTCEDNKKRFDALYLTHCMENDWRRDLIYSNYGKSSVELYHERGLLDSQTVLFHGVHLQENDIDILSETGASIVHCPVSNLWTGAGIAPVHNLLVKGANVCIGTDYGSVDIWETMKMAYLLLKSNGPIQQNTADTIFKMASYNGAIAYQQDAHGLIQDGFTADLVFIKKDQAIPEIHTTNFSTIVHNLLMETKQESITHVMVDGEWIMYDQKLTKIDEHTINQAYNRILTNVYND